MHFFKIFCTAVLTSFSTLSFAEQPTETTSPKIVVVGAGLAGLTAAYRLQEKGFDVEIYEARNRVGGRLFSVLIEGQAAELGGQNILDGGEAASTRALAQEMGLELAGGKIPLKNIEYREKGQSFDIAGLLKEKQFHPEELQVQLESLAENCSNMREVLGQLFEENDPIYKALALRLSAWEGGPIERLSTSCSATLYHQILGGVSATHPADPEFEPTAEVLYIQGGNSLLPKKLAEALEGKVHLNTPLRAVAKTPEGKYHLEFANGKQAIADILVLALPASVYSDIQFEKGLIPADRLEAMKRIEYGTVTRIVSPAASSGNPKAIFGDSMLVLQNPKLPYFTLYCVGESSRFNQGTVASLYQRGLQLMGIKAVPAKAPTMARDELLASYKGPVAYSWPNDPYVKGSYSYIAAGQEEILTAMEEIEGETVRTLFAPIDGALFFAGEHTTLLLDGIGTIEAACESGERTARVIEKAADQL